MITSLISLKISLYTPYGVYCEIYPSLECIDKFQFSMLENDILYLYCAKRNNIL